MVAHRRGIICMIIAGCVACCGVYTVVNAHEWMAPKTAGKIENPVPYGSESIARGKEFFLDSCSACHGNLAEGMKAKEAGLSKDVPNLKKRLATHTDGDFFWKIQEGRGDMPAFKDDLTAQETWDVINFIKSDSK